MNLIPIISLLTVTSRKTSLWCFALFSSLTVRQSSQQQQTQQQYQHRMPFFPNRFLSRLAFSSVSNQDKLSALPNQAQVFQQKRNRLQRESQQQQQQRRQSTRMNSSSSSRSLASQSSTGSTTPAKSHGSGSGRNKALEFPWKDHYQVMLPQCILPLNEDSYKGSSGRIAIVGGSPLYTGAPYYAATAALQTGADLVTIFTAQEATIPLKCYSPELMVQPIYTADVLNDITQQKDWTVDDISSELAKYPAAKQNVQDMVQAVTENINRYHCLIVGPGLGRCPMVGYAVAKILQKVRRDCPNMPVVLDADALWFLSQSKEEWQEAVVRKNEQIILTPNRMEYQRLLCEQNENTDWGQAATIIQKGARDSIGVGFDAVQPILCVEPGGMKRSGGIGDILAGTTGTLAAWQYILRQRSSVESSWIPAAWTACHLVKRATRVAWQEKKRAMTAPDILHRLGSVFDGMIGQEYNEP